MITDVTELSFEYSCPEGEERQVGYFLLPITETWKRCEEKFDKILETADDPDLYLKTILDILELEPFFLDAYAHLGNYYFNNDYIEEAERWYEKGLNQARPALPEKFSGTIEWIHLNNRPFLRLHYGYILCQLGNEKFKKAVTLMEEHLSWNVNDNLGVRFLIGEACLMSGMTRKASSYLNEIKDHYPPSAYSLALLEFRKKKFVEAATLLRLGIATNHYIAEGLTGRVNLKPHFYEDIGPYSTNETAKDYLDHSGFSIWGQVDGAIAFCDWLFNSAAVLRERAEVVDMLENLTYEHSPEIREIYLTKLSKFVASIDSTLSSKLVKKYINRNGSELWPWE